MRKVILSVIIATYNRVESLDKCLASLTKQSFKNFEVIIVDGGSKDETDKIINKYFDKLNLNKLVYPYFELSEVRDFGWQNSKGTYLTWIDDDVVLDKDWVKKAMEVFKKDKKIGGVSGPTIIPPNLINQRDAFGLVSQNNLVAKIWKNYLLEGKWNEVGKIFRSGAWSQGSNFKDCLKINDLIEVDYLEACNMWLRRELVEKVKGFDLKYRGTSEWCELDLAVRVKELGYKLVFSSDVALEHNVSKSGVFNKRMDAKQRMENFFRFYFLHIFKWKLDYIFRFVVYVIFLDGYWIYKFLKNRNIRWLGGVMGNVTGFLKNNFGVK